MTGSQRSRMLAYGCVVIFCALWAVIGLAYWQIGEYLARRNLPLSEQSPEVIASVYDGAVCLECSLFGPAIIFFSIGILLTTLAIYSAVEIVITAKSRASNDR